MPKAPENRINQVYGRWKVVAENERSYSLDHGKIRLKVRNFKVECIKCGWIKESVSWKNILYDCIGHNCKDNDEYIKSFDGLMNGQYGVSLIGKPAYNHYGTRHNILDVRIPEPDQYNFKTLIYLVQCTQCKKKKTTIYHSIISKDFVVCKCHKLKEEKTKNRLEMIREIDDEFEWMLELNKEGQLINYLMNKYPEENWEKILKDEDYSID